MCDSKAGAMGTAAGIQQKSERAPHCKARATAEVKNGHKASLQCPLWAGRLQLILGSRHAVSAGNSHDPLIKQVSFEDYMSTYPGQMTSQRSLLLVPGYCPANETEARVSGGFWEGFSALMKRDIFG